jgi:hypothetical protein
MSSIYEFLLANFEQTLKFHSSCGSYTDGRIDNEGHCNLLVTNTHISTLSFKFDCSFLQNTLHASTMNQHFAIQLPGYWSGMLSQFMFYVTDIVWNCNLFMQGSTEQIHCLCILFGLIKFLNPKHCLAPFQKPPSHSRHISINHDEISSEIWFRLIDELESFWKGVRTVEPHDCQELFKFTHVTDHLPTPTGSLLQPSFL